MVELRWVLLGLGVALLLGVYLWGRGALQRFLPRAALARRWLPSSPELRPRDAAPAAGAEPEGPKSTAVDPMVARATLRPDRVITVRFVPKSKQLSAEKAVLALRAAGLQHGRYGIFHRLSDDDGNRTLFSVASLTEPGSFDLTSLGKTSIPGMSFFMVLPGDGDPVACFDMMVGTARSLAHDLDAELHDERGSSWSIQRERYVREEIIEYRHQHSHA